MLESILGVATGLIGPIVTSWQSLKAQKVKNEHEIALLAAQTEATIKEAEANIKITETQVAGEIEKLEAAAYTESIKSQNVRTVSNRMIEKMYSNKWLTPLAGIITFMLSFTDFLKAIIRPGLTLYLTILTTYITYQAKVVIELQGSAISPEMAMDIWNQAVDTVFYLTVSAITWWFADRRISKFMYRLNDGNLQEK